MPVDNREADISLDLAPGFRQSGVGVQRHVPHKVSGADMRPGETALILVDFRFEHTGHVLDPVPNCVSVTCASPSTIFTV
jgi:hypothetical protein